MGFFSAVRRRMRRGPLSPRRAYDLWAAGYDDQPRNLMLHQDERAVRALAARFDWRGKDVLDVGCGTGRHWPFFRELGAARLTGCDLSERMLQALKRKYPGADVRLVRGTALTEFAGASRDILVSTLTIGHIADAAAALAEWARVLRPGGHALVTDFHPDALAAGAERTFHQGGRTRAVRNYVHPLAGLRAMAAERGLDEIAFAERCLDEEAEPYFREHGIPEVFLHHRGMPTHFAILWRKRDGGDPSA